MKFIVVLAKHVLLLLFTFGIWYYIWIYRMTGYTNAAENEEYRDPTKKITSFAYLFRFILFTGHTKPGSV